MSIEAPSPLANLGTPSGKSELDLLNEETPEPEDITSSDETDTSSEETEETDEDTEGTEESESDVLEEEEETQEETETEEDDEEVETDESQGDISSIDFKSLKAAYPDIFKKFPELRPTLFREQKFSALFPTVEDAQVAHKSLETYNALEQDLLDGNPNELFTSIAKTDKEVFKNLAHNLLPSIYEQDKDLYAEIIHLPLKRAIQQCYLAGKKSGNKNLLNAALFVDDYYFEGEGIAKTPEVRKKAEKTPEVIKLEKERDEHVSRLESNFVGDVRQIIEYKLSRQAAESIVKFEFDNYKSKRVTQDIITEVNRLLAEDKRYQTSIKSLFNQAKSAGFSTDWKSRVANAFLERAKAVLPLAKRKVIEEATGKKVEGKKPIKRVIPTNSSGRVPGKIDINKIDRSKTSDLDILNDTITYRK